MNLIKKMFDPFGENKEKKQYKDISKDSQRIAPTVPSDLFLYCRNMAGEQIQRHMVLLNDCVWIRAEYTYPAFDSMNFLYKNKIFSVIIDIQDGNGQSMLPEEFIKRQLYASKIYNLIPCKFVVTVPNPLEPCYEDIKPKTKGWNLYNTETDEEIIPEHLATTEKAEMSEWEIRNLSLKFVMKNMIARKLVILSFQDTLEVDPQIWFSDPDGRKCWIVVRTSLTSETEVKKPPKLNEIIRRCFKNDGYFVGVHISPINEDEKDKNLYRGGNFNIKFVEFEKIHSIM